MIAWIDYFPKGCRCIKHSIYYVRTDGLSCMDNDFIPLLHVIEVTICTSFNFDSTNLSDSTSTLGVSYVNLTPEVQQLSQSSYRAVH